MSSSINIDIDIVRVIGIGSISF